MVTPAAGREAVAHLRGKFAMSERRACRVVAVDRSSMRYQRRRPDDDPLCEWLEALVEERRRFGYRRLWVLLRREGHTSTAIGFPAVQERAADGASTRQAQARHRGSLAPLPLKPNQRWTLDFTHDQMTDGRRLRILAVVDDYTRECLPPVADTSISGIRIARELDTIIAERGLPGDSVSDNGTELTPTAILAWRISKRSSGTTSPGQTSAERLHRKF